MRLQEYNIDNGYLEGLCRGFKNGILKQADYLNLVQCETLDGIQHKCYKCIHNLTHCNFLKKI